jgi:ribulose-5-phosphate 4-epimerase/fuculose-1-phosphate aldolase
MSASLKSMPGQNEAERQARVDLAACYRLAARFGLNEGIDNHFTLLLPGQTDRFLVPPFGLHWSEIRAADFMVVDLAGRIISGRGPLEDTALYIHASVHRASPQGRCVLHTHMPYATALGMLADPHLAMAVQSALGFDGDISYDADYGGLALDWAEGERLARALGDKSVLLMRNHGALVVGATVPVAFERLYFLERAAMAQVLALSTGRDLNILPASIVQKTSAQFAACAMIGGQPRADLHFAALKRLLDRHEADYAS